MARLQTPRKTAAGLGASKSGADHFIAQRASAVALVPLVIWFLIGLVSAVQGGYADARAFAGHPVNAVLLLLLVSAAFFHMHAGLSDVLEDYVEGHGARVLTMLLNTFVAVGLWAVAVVSILKLAL
jgi:succinate dehydrogenase / fumarate reductase, membrane anchor subunit